MSDEPQRIMQRVRRKMSAFAPEYRPGDIGGAAVLVPLIDRGRGGSAEIILTRRAPHLSSHSGEVAFPGGKFDLEDGSLQTTALRESEEEIGLCSHRVDVVGELTDYVTRYGVNVTPYVGIIEGDVDLVPNTHELDAIFHVPVAFFLERDNISFMEMQYRGRRRQVPVFQYREYRIWGVTAAILAQFLNVAFDAGIRFEHPKT